jgi:flap endonuclease-1
VYAAGSEDMDTLTFNAPILYRHLTFSEAKKAPISEINLQKALEGLEMDMSKVYFKCTLIIIDTQVSQVYRPLYITWLRLP